MSQPYRPSPLTPESAQNMILGVGAVFHDVDLEGIDGKLTAEEFSENYLAKWAAAGHSLGASEGDVTLNITREMERITTNDLFADVVGMFDARSMQVSLSMTLQDMSDKNWERMLATTYNDSSDGSMMMNNVLLPHHYKTVVWAAMMNNGDIIAIALLNAIQTEDLSITFSNTIGTPASAAVSFTGTVRTLEEMRNAPFKRWRFAFSGGDNSTNAGDGTTGIEAAGLGIQPAFSGASLDMDNEKPANNRRASKENN